MKELIKRAFTCAYYANRCAAQGNPFMALLWTLALQDAARELRQLNAQGTP